MSLHRVEVFLFSVLIMCACNSSKSTSSSQEAYCPSHRVDSLLDNCANPYEIALELSKHPFDVLSTPIEPSPYTNYTIKTSADGNFRVYSILAPMSSIYDVHNIFLYRNGKDEYDVHVKADQGDWGYIINIGMVPSEKKTYYLLVSEYVSYHQGMFCTTMISAYSLSREIYNSLKREQLFITKSGNLTDIIEVSWDDDGANKDWTNLFGISLSNTSNTQEIYIQVISAKTGNALDRAIVYKWDGQHFVYSGLKGMCVDRNEL